jgi:hypothetical protein
VRAEAVGFAGYSRSPVKPSRSARRIASTSLLRNRSAAMPREITQEVKLRTGRLDAWRLLGCRRNSVRGWTGNGASPVSVA